MIAPRLWLGMKCKSTARRRTFNRRDVHMFTKANLIEMSLRQRVQVSPSTQHAVSVRL